MTQTPLFLAFDTSAAHCAAAVMQGDEVVADETLLMGRGQAEALLPLVQRLLAEAGFNIGALDAIAVGTGPGNFTGTRISVALARGLALGAGIPAYGVSLLSAYAGAQPLPALVCLPARRNAVYILGSCGAAPTEPEMIDLDLLTGRTDFSSALPCVGAAAAEVAERLGRVVVEFEASPAVAVGRAALALWRDGSPVERPAPLYLRPADAAPARDAPPTILT